MDFGVHARATACLLLLCSGGLSGCEKALGRQQEGPPSPKPVAVASEAAPAPGGPMTSIPAGELRAGSRPGDPRRDPAREADLVPIALEGFSIDRALFPNAPATPAKVADYAGASAACKELGKRLCGELEWERACELAGAESFIASTREWTLSDDDAKLASTRGGGQAPARCATRSFAPRTTELSFRCCRGPQQPATYPSPEPTPAAELGAEPLSMTPDAMREALAAIPELAALSSRFEPFTAADADAALRRGKRSRDGITAWSFLPAAASWMPAPSEELVLLSGRSGDVAVIAVLYALGDGGYAHAASAILREPDATVAIAERAGEPAPRELLWTSCYGCPNEGGTIRYGDDRRVVIEFR